MEKYIEVVLRGSNSETLENTTIIKNPIIKFNIEFATSDLSEIEKYFVTLSQEIYGEKIKLDFKNEIVELEKYINDGYKIRIWTSHYDINSCILLLYICNYIENKVEKIEVVYADEYDKEIYSIGCIKNEKIEKLLSFEHNYSKKEIEIFSKEWDKIRNTNTELRIIEDKKIKLVSYDYFDTEILKIINKKQTSIISLAVDLSNKYYLSETVFIYLIKRLIDINKIKIIKQSEKYIENIIE